MRIIEENNKTYLYADEDKLLDFKEPHYVLNDDHEMVQVHLYSPKLRLGRMDSADNYIEVNKLLEAE